MEEINVISGRIVDAAYRLHKTMGPGLTESVYETVLARDIARISYRVERQKPISFEYDGMWFSNVARRDLIVDGVLPLMKDDIRRVINGYGKSSQRADSEPRWAHAEPRNHREF